MCRIVFEGEKAKAINRVSVYSAAKVKALLVKRTKSFQRYRKTISDVLQSMSLKAAPFAAARSGFFETKRAAWQR